MMLRWTFVYRCVFKFLLSVLSSFCICPEVGCLDHKLILYFTFWGTAKLFPIVTALFYIPTSIMRVPSSSHPCQHLFFILKKQSSPSDISAWCTVFQGITSQRQGCTPSPVWQIFPVHIMALLRPRHICLTKQKLSQHCRT